MTNTTVNKVDGRWVKPCPSCGQPQSYLRRNYAEHSLRLGKECKSCSNRRTENSHRGFFQRIRISWFTKARISAETRGIVFDLSIKDVWALYIEQNRCCALTGLPIGWASVGACHTASIDRIDPSLPYRIGNIQLLHKDVNMMKQSFSQAEFVTLCSLVAQHHSC
jgi:hypothetical protein